MLIAVLLVSVVTAIVTDTTGAPEKALMAAVALLLVIAASRVRRLGTQRSRAPWSGYRAVQRPRARS